MVEERTCELEDRSIEINQKSKEEEDRGQRDSLRALWNMKQSNTHVTGIPGEESRRGHEREEKGRKDTGRNNHPQFLKPWHIITNC